MADTALAALPRERPPINPATDQPPPPFDWGALVGRTVHPVKVAIIEALLWVGNPLSANELNELSELLAELHYNGDVIGYHANGLSKLGVIGITDARRVRGVREKYYSLC